MIRSRRPLYRRRRVVTLCSDTSATAAALYNLPMNSSSGSVIAVDVLVAGRGAIGACTALAAARQGRRVALVGPALPLAPQPAPGCDNRVFALSPPSIALLRELGVWQALDSERFSPITRMRVWPRADSGAPMLEFDAQDSAEESLAVIVEGGELNRVLAQALQFSSVQTIDASVVSWRADPLTRAELELSDGRAAQARLVVGCDGADSPLRALAGIESSFRDYQQRAIVANFRAEKPHRDTAYQWFGTHGVLALLPLASGSDLSSEAVRAGLSMVWSVPHALGDELLGLSSDALAERVSQVSGQILGELRPLSAAGSYPLRLGRVKTLLGERLALAGDAAHVVHPLAGQGMNLGFGDVAALCEAIKGAPDPGARLTLRRYERSRAEPVATMRVLTDGLQGLFDPDRLASLGTLAAPLVAARDLGWRAVASSAWLRRQLVVQAGRR